MAGHVRGLSPILSTMILLSAALIAGILLYTYFTNTMRGMANAPNVAVEQAAYYPSVGLLYVKIRNYGGAPVDINNSKINVIVDNATCSYVIICSKTAMLKPFQSLTIQLYANGLNSTSIEGCILKLAGTTTSEPSKCLEALASSSAYVTYTYLYAGSEQSTQPVSVTLG